MPNQADNQFLKSTVRQNKTPSDRGRRARGDGRLTGQAHLAAGSVVAGGVPVAGVPVAASPVCLTSWVVVSVWVPWGVSTVVFSSTFDFSPQPVSPSGRDRSRALARIRFI